MRTLTGTGIWSADLRYGDPGRAAEAASELESLGYSALWLPDVGGDLFGALERVLAATDGIVVASGVLNLWLHTPEETAHQHSRLVGEFGDRLLLGIGVSHEAFINAGAPGRYRQPLAAMRGFLDGLDGAEPPLRHSDRMLAALGPKMLDLARDRAAGTHSYNVTPEHTARARGVLGPEALVAPEMAVAMTTDPDEARTLGRAHLAVYLTLPNYTDNLRRLGYGDIDLDGAGSDRLVDALVAWGDPGTIRDRIQEHRDAGADHVCIQLLGGTDGPPLEQWRALAPALTG